MTTEDDAERRFRVISGDGRKRASAEYVAKGKRERVELYRCDKCTDEVGYQYHALVQHRRNSAIVTDAKGGKLSGGSLWWCCARCGEPKFRIRGFATRDP